MKTFLALSLSYVVFILLINVKMPTIVGILTFKSRINFVLSWVEHGKSIITSGPGDFFMDGSKVEVPFDVHWVIPRKIHVTSKWYFKLLGFDKQVLNTYFQYILCNKITNFIIFDLSLIYQALQCLGLMKMVSICNIFVKNTVKPV